MGFERIDDIRKRHLPQLRNSGGPVRGHQGLQRQLAPEPACECGDCIRANHGQPAVKFPSVLWRKGYELHGLDAKRWYDERAKGLAALSALKLKLRGADRAGRSQE